MSNSEQKFQTEPSVYGLSEMKWKRRSGFTNVENANCHYQNDRSRNELSQTDSFSNPQSADHLLEECSNLNCGVRNECENELESKSSASLNNKNGKSTTKETKEILNENKRFHEIHGNDDHEHLCKENKSRVQFSNENMFLNEPESRRNSNYSNRDEARPDRNNDYPKRNYRSEKENVDYERWLEQGETFPKQFFKKIPVGSKYHREFYLTRKEFETKKRIIEKKKNPFIPTEKPLNSAKSFSLEVFDVRFVDKIKSNENIRRNPVEIDLSSQNLITKTATSQSKTFTQEFSSLNINATPFCPSTSSYDERNSVSESSFDFSANVYDVSKQVGNAIRTLNQELPSNNATVKTRKGYLLNKGFKKSQADSRINQDLIQTLNELDAQRLRNVPNSRVTEELSPITSTIGSSNGNVAVVNASPVILNNVPQPLCNDLMIPVVIPASKLANLREYFPEATPFLFSAAQSIDMAAAMVGQPKAKEIVSQEYIANAAPAVIDESTIVSQRFSGTVEVSNNVTPVPVSSIAVINQPQETSETLLHEYNANVPPPSVPSVPAVMPRNPYRAVKSLMQNRPNFSNQATYVSVPNPIDSCGMQGGNLTSLIAQHFPSQSVVTNTDYAANICSTQSGNVLTSLIAQPFPNQSQDSNANFVVSSYRIPNGNVSTSLMTQPLTTQTAVSTSFENRPMFSEQVRITSDQPDSITINIDNNYAYDANEADSPSVSF